MRPAGAADGSAGADPLTAIAGLLRAEGGLLGEVVVDPGPAADRRIAQALAGAPRADVIGPDLALAAEATREAELVHHVPERARIVRTDDRDLALLAGDRLLALGLERLAAGGWTAEVAILADVVALVARLHAGAAWALGPAHHAGTGAPATAQVRTAALWSVAAGALGTGAESAEARLLRVARAGRVPGVVTS
ncbi:hypothetical protein SK069_12830 [Patulibacter brassicae]|uniref:Uncharacterized protein n=1 Tax=Patulibacter brassicae TaxID=1705717 RepID=A0ABU4VKY2_9ACTN|nr:hypothetical protein [Patulibacter brassicae]MDX8152485.1 hypothetical protein [Patulibacter brassicae]